MRLGEFGMARDIFEEALDTQSMGGVKTVRDFGLVFNAYLKFENQLLDIEDQLPLEMGDVQDQALLQDFRHFRIRNLLSRRAFVLSDVLLNANPHDTEQWLTRIKLCDSLDDPSIKAQVYSRAILNIDPQQALGDFSKVWISFAHFLESIDEEEGDDLENANLVFHKAAQVNFKTNEERASIILAWAEMHVHNNNLDSAVEILKYACSNK